MKSYLEFGGVFEIGEIKISPENMNRLIELFQILEEESYCHYLFTSYQKLFNSQNSPRFNCNIIQDLPVVYLGYNRRSKTTLLTKIKECWRILTNKPSRAYYTNENDEIAKGMWKEAMRVTNKADDVRKLSEIIYDCRTTEDYVIPAIQFIPEFIVMRLENLSDRLLLTPFTLR